MKLCIPVHAKSENELFALLKKAAREKPDLLEIWLDDLKNPDIKKIINATEIPFIFLNRKNPDKKNLLNVIKYKAAFIDLDVNKTPISAIKKIITGKKETKIILSHHDFQKTRSSEQLEKIIKKMFSLGADIAKIATVVKKDEDKETLLSLLKKMKKMGKKVIIHGMGGNSKNMRMKAARLGSEIAYVALDIKYATAEGQWNINEWRKKWKKGTR